MPEKDADENYFDPDEIYYITEKGMNELERGDAKSLNYTNTPIKKKKNL